MHLMMDKDPGSGFLGICQPDIDKPIMGLRFWAPKLAILSDS